MTRKFLSLILFVSAIFTATAQTPVKFTLHTDGSFADVYKNKYITVDMPGMTASEIYDNMMMNVLYLYVQPNDVASGVAGKMIKVRGHKSGIKFKDSNGNEQTGNAYYTIVFWIKDGKVLIEAPHLENIKLGTAKIGRSQEITARQLASYYFNSPTGADLKSLEDDLNYFVNFILGILPEKNYPNRQNW